MVDLDRIRVVHSSLTDTIYLARFDRANDYALDKREAEADAMTAIVSHMMHEAPRGSRKEVRINGRRFELKVRPLSDDDRRE